MHACPTRAIRVKNGTALILDDLCIDCGECVTACERGAIVPLIDTFKEMFKKFKVKIALPSPVIYTQFDEDVLPNDVLVALRRIGFDFVCDEAYICEMTSFVIERYFKEHLSGGPFISSVCPVIIRLIQKRFHDLIPAIIPIESPREIAARELKQRYSKKLNLNEDEIGVIYITPCSAKINSIKDHPTKRRSYIDGAIGINEVYRLIAGELRDIREGKSDDDEVYARASGIGISWAMSGGEISSFDCTGCVAVPGIKNVIKILDGIERGMFHDIHYFELRACEEGCIGGNLNVDDRYIARMKLLRLVDMFGKIPRFDRAKMMLTYKDYFPFEKEPDPIFDAPIDDRREAAIEKLNRINELYSRLKKIDCGACGSPDCRTFAEDVVRGISSLQQCIFMEGEEA